MDRHTKALELLRKGTVIPATPLALTADRKLDPKRQRVLTRYYLDAGVGGIATAVHTTQFEIRDPNHALFEPVLCLVSEEIERFEQRTGSIVIKIAGVCGDTEQAVNEAKIAKQYGYDAVLLSPGGLCHLTEEALVERTRAVASVLPVIGFYLQPAVGGRRFTYRYWEQICEIPNVVAIKAAPFDRYMTLDLVRAAAFSTRADQITLYTGNDDNLVMDLLTRYRFTENGRTAEKSFEGGLLGHWSVWTKTVVDMFHHLKQVKETGSIAPELLTLAAAVTDCNAAFFDTANNFRGCIAGLHEVLRRQGLLDGIWCLDPAETLSPGQVGEIDRVYRMYPQLNDDTFVRENLSRWLED